MTAAQPVRILVADDHPDNVDLLRIRLGARGYLIDAVTDGQQALDRVLADPPDLLLLDVMMPKMDGMEVARRIKETPGLPFVPIILQTALDTTAHKVEGLDAGADDYITKPINFAELEARIKALLRIKALQEELERANAELRRVSQTDGLTGVDNRRHIEERLTEAFEHAARLNETLAVVMTDVDHFKSVNDTYGHQAGDAVLKQVAAVLRESAREIDHVGSLRWGGVPRAAAGRQSRGRPRIRRAGARGHRGPRVLVSGRHAAAHDERGRRRVATRRATPPGSARQGGGRRTLCRKVRGAESRRGVRRRGECRSRGRRATAVKQ